jgi:hypothetical protein
MFVYHLPGGPKVGQYNVDQNAWVDSGMEFAGYQAQGVAAVTDPTTGYIYLTGGYADTSYSFVNKYLPSRPDDSLSRIPYPASAFVARWYVANVFCKRLGGILYFGGYNLQSGLVPGANVITLLNVSTDEFSTIVSFDFLFRNDFVLFVFVTLFIGVGVVCFAFL